MEGIAVVLLFLGVLYFFSARPASFRLKGIIYFLLSLIFFLSGTDNLGEKENPFVYLSVIVFLFAFGALYPFLSTLQNENVEELNDFDD